MYMENIFSQIAKLLALPTIKKNIDKAGKMMEEDPELQSIIYNIKWNTQVLNDKLPSFCKRHPDSELCKDTKKKDK